MSLTKTLIKQIAITVLVSSLLLIPIAASAQQISFNSLNRLEIALIDVHEALDKQRTPLQRLYDKAPIMRKIAECESNDRQFDKNGDPLIGFSGWDKGRFQINVVHWEKAEKMGINLNTVQGNARFAEHLYDKKGTQPWYKSKHCWKKYKR